MRARKHLLAASASIVLMSLSLAACASGDTGSGNGSKPTSSVANWQKKVKAGKLDAGVLEPTTDPSYKLRKDLVAGLEKDYPGTKVTLTFANSLARPALEQRWRSGKGPDVDYGMFDGTNPNQLKWGQEGFLLNLRPYLEQTKLKSGQTWLKSFTPGAAKFMEDPKSHAIYGVPTELSSQVLYYNKKMFRDLGIKAPTTWDEFLTACKTLKGAGTDPISVTGLFLPYLRMWTDNIWNRTVAYDKAAAVLSRGKGHITDDPGFLKGLELFEGLVKDKDFIKSFQSTDFAPAESLFYQGKAGMILNGNWIIGEQKTLAPKGFELGVLPFPSVSGASGDQHSVLSTAQLVSVNAKSKNIPLALEWILRNTSASVQKTSALEYGKLAAVQGAPGPTGGADIESVMNDASTLQPRDFGMAGSPAYDLANKEVARLAYGQQDAKTTLQRLDAGLRKIYHN